MGINSRARICGGGGGGGSDNAVDVMVMLVMMTMRGKRGETLGSPQNRTNQTVLLRHPQKTLKVSEWGKDGGEWGKPDFSQVALGLTPLCVGEIGSALCFLLFGFYHCAKKTVSGIFKST